MSPLRSGKATLVVIAGPTASGKSALALRLALHLRQTGIPAEILCADSITVFRGFELGAAKPSPADRALVPHHLLDIADPDESFTAGHFVRHAQTAIAEIYARGALPILVGGTGFYLRALLRGMASQEAEEPELAATVKRQLEARALLEGWPKLHAEVMARDPGSAGVVHPNDHYRILRALQAMELYQRPWSELNRAARATDFRYPGTRYFCLDIDREVLRARITARTETMLKNGLVAEVENLLAAGVPASTKPLQSVGYQECREMLAGKIPPAQLAERIVQSTLRLAKQQRTWFRSENGVEWLVPDYFSPLLAALGL